MLTSRTVTWIIWFPRDWVGAPKSVKVGGALDVEVDVVEFVKTFEIFQCIVGSK
jgi:hypothetical protein